MMTLEEFKKRAEETDDWAPKWGYEMTIKLPETDNENCMWAISLLYLPMACLHNTLIGEI